MAAGKKPRVQVGLLLLAVCAMASCTHAKSTDSTSTTDIVDYTAEQREYIIQRISDQIDHDIDPAYNGTIDEQPGNNAFIFRSQAPQCVTTTKGWLADPSGKPSCLKVPVDGSGTDRWLCWFYATFTSSCRKRDTKTISFNCCDKDNGLFYALNANPHLSLAPGPNMSPSSPDCSCEFNVRIAPGQSRTLHYLAYGRTQINPGDNPNLTPWDTFVTAAKFWPNVGRKNF